MGWLQALMFCVSLYSLALIGLTRMMLVSRNKRKYNEWCTPKMGYVWIFLSWIISLALTLIPEKVPSLKPLLGEYGYHAKFRCCLWEEEMQDLKFSWGTVISLFVMIPSILVASFCYYKIYRIARKSKMRIRANDSVQPSKSVTQLAPHGASENVTTSMNNYALPVANASTTVVVKNNFLNDQKEEIRYVDQDSVKIDKKFSSTKQQPALKKTTIIHIDKTKYNKIHPYDYPSMEKYEKSTAYESTAEFAFTSTTNNVQGNNVSILENVISRRARHRFVREHKTNIFLLVFFVAFTVCWFPWNLIVLLENYVHFPLWFFRLAPVLSLTNSAINPFTYGFLNEKFRSPYSKLSQHLKSILGRHRIQA